MGGGVERAGRYLIREELDVYEARRAVRGFAAELGFQRQACEELVIVVSELGSNILKYGTSGEVRFAAVKSDRFGDGLRVSASDVGPPFADLALALLDGCSDRGPIDPSALLHRRGFGGGLGAVVRLTDAFEHRAYQGGKEISVVRYLRRPRPGEASSTG